MVTLPRALHARSGVPKSGSSGTAASRSARKSWDLGTRFWGPRPPAIGRCTARALGRVHYGTSTVPGTSTRLHHVIRNKNRQTKAAPILLGTPGAPVTPDDSNNVRIAQSCLRRTRGWCRNRRQLRRQSLRGGGPSKEPCGWFRWQQKRRQLGMPVQA